MERNEETLAFLERESIEYRTASIEDEETQAWVAEFNPDVIFSLYYREIIPKAVPDMAAVGCMNLHPSLLPKHRGVLSVPWAMVKRDSTTGYTYHHITEEVDAGNIVHQEEVEILDTDTAFAVPSAHSYRNDGFSSRAGEGT